MPSVLESVGNYFLSGDQASEDIILGYCESRNESPKNLEEFFEVLNILKTSLSSTDCKILARTFLLLQAICSKIGEDTLSILSFIHGEARFRDFSNHPDRGSCTWCDIVAAGERYLRSRFAEVVNSLRCVLCRKNPRQFLKLPCSHNVCKECWTIKKLKEIICTHHKKQIRYERDWIKETSRNTRFFSYEYLAERAKSYYGTSSEAKNTQENMCKKVNCPNCHKEVFVGSGLEHVPCHHCNYFFCTHCFRAYHGFSRCDEDSFVPAHTTTKLGSDVSNSFSTVGTSVDATTMEVDTQVKLGPEAQQYETDYYSPAIRDQEPQTFSADEVRNAFEQTLDCNSSAQEIVEVEWPWEVKLDPGTFCYAPGLRSLQPENWVEDELLETAIKNILSAKNIHHAVGFLESYVANFAFSKGAQLGELAKILVGKNILENAVVLVLLNTESHSSGGHWILGVMQIKLKKLVLLDSSLVISKSYYRRTFFILLHILHIAHKLQQHDFQPKDWELYVVLDGVQQNNPYDCGPLVVCNAYAFTTGIQLRRPPNSAMMRAWLRHILINEKTVPGNNDDKNANPEHSENKISDEGFLPKGLVIRFEFLDAIGLS